MCLLIIALLIAQTGAYDDVPSPWQFSETVNVELTVRNKFGPREGYEGTFIVYTPDGLRLTKSVRVVGDEFGSAIFPDDFSSPSVIRSGRYRWECIVSGRAVVGGSFTVALSSDSKGARPPKKRRMRRRTNH